MISPATTGLRINKRCYTGRPYLFVVGALAKPSGRDPLTTQMKTARLEAPAGGK
jgi:hypothetical protein